MPLNPVVRLGAAWRIGALVLAFGLAVNFAEAVEKGRWVATWVSSQELLDPPKTASDPGLSGHTIRQVVQPSLAGDGLRVMFSNLVGDSPLTIGAASIARANGGSAIQPDSACALTFSGSPNVTIQPGAAMISDIANFPVRAFENLAVTVYCPEVPAKVTGHRGSRTTSFIVAGDAVAAPEFSAPRKEEHWYLLAEIDVRAAAEASAVVAIGDSITDGRGSTTDQNDRWTNNLARRLAANAATAQVSVLNQGIGGGRLLRHGLGPSALSRFDRDVLAPAGVTTVIVFEGVNDLGTAVGARKRGEAGASARDVIMAYEQMILRAHLKGLRIYGATITPFEGFKMYNDDKSEAERTAVNHWIRTSGQFDAVIDFDAMTRDPQNPSRLSAAVDSGDHLHPSAAGYHLMADRVDLALFEAGTRP
ncbi:MAG TPA: SGNH/GDSL hydrolase family protein [Lacunisphaera sp.]|nr:SGNH/GDSL hydrolase family protein [Lacunisphaera sp.]